MATAFDTEIDAPEMGTLASLAEAVVYRLPGCSDVMVRKILQQVYRDFCMRSCALRGTHVVHLAANTSRYRICTSRGSIIAVADANVSYDNFTRRLHHREYKFDPGSGTISFIPALIPTQDNDTPEVEVRVETVEVPRMGDETVPLNFIQAHGDAIASGALAMLMAMANRPWSDPQQALVERASYENAVNGLRVSYCANNGIVGGPNPDELL